MRFHHFYGVALAPQMRRLALVLLAALALAACTTTGARGWRGLYLWYSPFDSHWHPWHGGAGHWRVFH